MADFSAAYADQNERDYEALVRAVRSGRVAAETRPLTGPVAIGRVAQ